MADIDTVVQVSNLGKRFSRNPEKARRPGAKQVISAMIGLGAKANSDKLREDEFWALTDVSFNLKRGEALGIVGLNGAGKSTLLKILLQRLQPDTGTVEVSGRAGGLIELGAGFHPELSGRRNIGISASMLGASEQQAAEAAEGIIEFADIGSFIDSPVKTYSSGMKVRLGFAIAVTFVPDVVICDEILAVGDFEFRQKCLQRIKAIRRTKSVILVSHSASDIALFCDRAMLLHQGELILIDSPENVLRAYSTCTRHCSVGELRIRIRNAISNPAPKATTLKPKPPQSKPIQSKIPTGDQPQTSSDFQYAPLAPTFFANPGNKTSKNQSSTPPSRDNSKRQLYGPEFWNKEAIANVSIAWNLEQNENGFFLFSGDSLVLNLQFTLLRATERFRIGFPVFDANGSMILGPDSRHDPEVSSIARPGEYRIEMRLNPLPLNFGYFTPAISFCDDPAQLFRKHLPAFHALNPLHEFGVAKTFSEWTANATPSPEFSTILSC